MENSEENFTYIFYQEPDSAKMLAEECQTQGTDCETWMIEKEQNLNAEGLSHTSFGYVVQTENSRLGELYLNGKEPSCMVSSRLAAALFGSEKATGKNIIYQGHTYTIKHTVPYEMPVLFLNQDAPAAGDARNVLSVSMVRGMNIKDCQNTENLFRGSDARIDVNLLKWIIYLTTFSFLLGIFLFIFAQLKETARKQDPLCTDRLQNRNLPSAKQIYLPCLLLWLCYLKLEIFSDMAEFPIWSLPGKWSDLEGWGNLWETIRTQLAVIFQFRDYPILRRYYHSLAGCSFHLALCFLSLWALLKNNFFCNTSEWK